MDKKLVLATRNLGKQREMQSLLSETGWTVLTLKDYPDCPDVVEDGATFLENAAKKALAVSFHTGLPAVADDSGLAVDALSGAPGIYSSRYARGEGSTDEENLQKVLENMNEVPDEKRTARFVCAAVVAVGGRVAFQTEQTVEGVLTRDPRGENGFGYDPIFFYPPLNKTTAELSADEKNGISHRGKAMREVVGFLAENG